jgi:tetratricopeptide (TPR) repeat protein
VDPSAIGRELGVRAILTGSVVSHGEDLDMQVDLLDAKNGSRLWRKNYQRPIIDLLRVQNEIVAEVASTLGLQRGAAKSDTNSSEAYQLYLQGRYSQEKQNAEGIRKMGEYFKKAITIDPKYALAYVGLADYYGQMAAGGLAPGAEYWPKSEDAAVKALALDESIGEAHRARALVWMWHDRNWLRTESELKRAIELEPGLAPAYASYAQVLGVMGRFDDAIAAAKRSSEVDPRSREGKNPNLAEVYFYARRYDLAVEEYRKSIENDSGAELPHLGLAEVYVQQKKFTEALAEARKAKDLIRNPGQRARLGGIFAAAGDKQEATKILAEVKDRSSKRVAYFTASIYAALGNSTEAFACLTRAVDEFDTKVMYLKVDPRFDPVRHDDRFKALLGRMHLLQ